MAASDNVVRLGLTPKFKDKETILQMLNYESKSPNYIEPYIE
jgi:mannose-6-phosphate isomerase class I